MADRAVTVTIANGASLSGVGTIPPGFALAAIVMPATWTAASLTFQASHNDGLGAGTYNNVYDVAGTEFQAQASASRWIAIDPVDFLGAPFIKVRSGTSGAAVAQGGNRDLVLVLRAVS